MSEATCQREHCSVCGSLAWDEAHFVAGVLVCTACWREIRRAPSTPTASQMHSNAPHTQRKLAFGGQTRWLAVGQTVAELRPINSNKGVTAMSDHPEPPALPPGKVGSL
jgi:hypothetical protein